MGIKNLLNFFFLFLFLSLLFFIKTPRPVKATCNPPQLPDSKFVIINQPCPSGCEPSKTSTAGIAEKECCCPSGTSDPDTGGGESKPEPTLAIRGSCGENEIDTALGCVPTGDFNGLIVWVLKIAISISGGIAFLLMIFGGFRVLVSAGNPKGVQSGNEMITSALIGLLFILFSIFLLKLIGVTIFELPGL